jgi:hypothetical protein
MPLTPRPFLAHSLQALTRSALFSLGLDHALIDFLTHTAVGAATVLLAILFVALRLPRRSPASLSKTPPNPKSCQ